MYLWIIHQQPYSQDRSRIKSSISVIVCACRIVFHWNWTSGPKNEIRFLRLKDMLNLNDHQGRNYTLHSYSISMQSLYITISLDSKTKYIRPQAKQMHQLMKSVHRETEQCHCCSCRPFHNGRQLAQHCTSGGGKDWGEADHFNVYINALKTKQNKTQSLLCSANNMDVTSWKT